MRNEKLSKIPDGEFNRTVVGGFPTEEELNQREREYNEMMAARESQQNAENQSNTENKPSGENQQTDETPETKPKDFSRRVELKFGYQEKDTDDEKGALHRDVVISRRPKGSDLIKAADNYSDFDLEYDLAMIAASITKFGDIKFLQGHSLPLTILLSLDEVDRDELTLEWYSFLFETAAGHETEILENGKAKLGFGVEHEGVRYDVVHFGKRLNAYDEIAVKAEAKTKFRRIYGECGRRIIKLSTADESQSVSTGLTLEQFESMDFSDILFLREAESQWLDSFR